MLPPSMYYTYTYTLPYKYRGHTHTWYQLCIHINMRHTHTMLPPSMYYTYTYTHRVPNAFTQYRKIVRHMPPSGIQII